MEQNQTTLEKLKQLHEKLVAISNTINSEDYSTDLSVAFACAALTPDQKALLNQAQSPSTQENFNELSQEKLEKTLVHASKHHVVTSKFIISMHAKFIKDEISNNDAEIILQATKALEHHTPIMMDNYKLMLQDDMPDIVAEIFDHYRNEILPLSAEISTELETQLQLSAEQNAAITQDAHSYDGHESFKPIDKDAWNAAAPSSP